MPKHTIQEALDLVSETFAEVAAAFKETNARVAALEVAAGITGNAEDERDRYRRALEKIANDPHTCTKHAGQSARAALGKEATE